VSTHAATSYDGYRWFQIEVSVFTNEYLEYRDAEYWSPERLQLQFPPRTRPYSKLADFLRIEDFAQKISQDSQLPSGPNDSVGGIASIMDEAGILIPAVGPVAPPTRNNLRFPDLDREPYYLLPNSLSDFETTNQRLERSPTNRLLFHALWRQPVVDSSNADSLLVTGGNQFDERFELEGSITIRFNQGEDRVVIDANLWLNEFTLGVPTVEGWSLPPLITGDSNTDSVAYPNANSRFRISRTVQMLQSREMRSNEFHYLDHPAIGLVISVFPYDLPLQITTDPGFD